MFSRFIAWIKGLGIDYIDIALHACGAFGMFTLLNIALGHLSSGLITIAFWLGREAWQSWKSRSALDQYHSLNPLQWSRQKHLEWLVAVVVVALMWVQV